MAHKTLIGGTAYEITGGKTLVDGTAYSIKSGKTLVGGTAYEVGFGPPMVRISFPNGTYIDTGYGYLDCEATQEGVWDGTDLIVPVGAQLCFGIGAYKGDGSASLSLNNVSVASVSGNSDMGRYDEYYHTVTTDTIVYFDESKTAGRILEILNDPATVAITADGNGEYAWLSIDGVEYRSAKTIEVAAGTEIRCYIKRESEISTIYLNGSLWTQLRWSGTIYGDYYARVNATIQLVDGTGNGTIYIIEE